ncbi:MAG: competence protein ComEC, partial [Burkholderiaceae bacterium]
APPGQAAAVALLTGDIEAAQESHLVSAGLPLAADILLVPHHGSATSSSAGFLDAVAPRLAVVQTGYRNRFGHPAAAPMARYAERAIPVRDSPHCGAMAWRSTEPARLHCERETRRRYWQHVLESVPPP